LEEDEGAGEKARAVVVRGRGGVMMETIGVGRDERSLGEGNEMRETWPFEVAAARVGERREEGDQASVRMSDRSAFVLSSRACLS
jgi:hypothetical protein